MNFTSKQIVYSVLAGLGLVATWYYNLQFMAESGGAFDVREFVAAGYANSASSSLSNDLAIGTMAFVVWSFAEAKRLGMRFWWVYLALTFAVAFAFSYPLFLLMRERKLAARGAEGG